MKLKKFLTMAVVALATIVATSSCSKEVLYYASFFGVGEQAKSDELVNRIKSEASSFGVADDARIIEIVDAIVPDYTPNKGLTGVLSIWKENGKDDVLLKNYDLTDSRYPIE